MSDSLQSLDDELIPAQQRENLMRLQVGGVYCMLLQVVVA